MRTTLFTHWPRLVAVLVLAIAAFAGILPTDPVSLAGGMLLATAPFPFNPALTAIATGYKNADMALIADDVLPYTPVGGKEFWYWQYALADGFTVPDTKVGRKSAPNQVEFSATRATGTCDDYGLDDPVPQDDIDSAPPGIDPLGQATMGVTNLLLLDREVRVAGMVFNANNYAAANKATLSGTSQWSDFTNSDPVQAVLAALDACVMRPNIGVFGRATWTKLSTHPKICKAIFGNNTDAGIVNRRQFADLFELADVFVGQGWVNTAKKGQAASLARVWGKHASFIYRDKLAGPQSGTTFGFTARFGGRVAGSIEDRNIGLKGGQRVRVGEQVKEVICANDLGYHFTNAVA